MYLRILFCLCLLTQIAFGQGSDTIKHNALNDSIEKGMAKMREISAQMDSLEARRMRALQEQTMQIDSAAMARNMDALVRLQKERDDKLKRDLWVKGSFFAVMLTVTIVGFVRRKRQKVKG